MIIGSVPYLNEKPLTRWFSHTEEGRASGIQVVYDVPSQLARQLEAGQLDAALVSAFEYFRTPGYAIVPGISISGQDEIESVRAFSHLPWRRTESVALDTSSLTSVALLIGDRGMLANSTGLNTLDLGHAWRRLTGLPFVYAVWLGRPERLTPQLVETLHRAKAWGAAQIEPIAEEQAALLGCSPAVCRRYLTQIMDYDLGEEHRCALETFGRKARALGLLSLSPNPLRLASLPFQFPASM